MNDKLLRLYEDKLQNLVFSENERKILSTPFLLQVTDDYINAEEKVMILGRETHNWGGKIKDFNISDIDKTIKRYEVFFKKRVKARQKSIGKSCFIHRLVKINNYINLNCKNTQFIWNNILKWVW